MKRRGLFIVTLVVSLFIVGYFNSISMAKEKEIVIGVMGPLKFASGRDMLAGAELGIQDINSKGGINVKGVKYKLKMVKADTNEYVSVSDSVSCMERLITLNNVNFLLGCHRSEATLAQMEVMADHKIVLLNVQSSSPKLNEKVASNYAKYKYWFRVGALNAVYLGKIGYYSLDIIKEKLKTECGIEKAKVALQFEKAVWGDAVIAGAKKALPEIGMEIVRIGRHSATATDLTSELMDIKNSGAHIILSGAAGPCATTLAKQWSELKIPCALQSVSTPTARKNHWKATDGGCEYQSTTTCIGPVEVTPLTVPWYQKFVEYTDEFPTPGGGVAAYDGLHLLKTAIEAAGTLNSDAVVNELEKIDRQCGVFGYWKFTGKDTKWPHDIYWAPGYITYSSVQWQNGKLEAFWPDGRAALGDERWKGVRYKGTKNYILPPWVVEHYKKNK